MDEYKWLTTNRAGRCVLCSAETHQGDRILWSLVDKKKIWCKACANKLGQTDPGDSKPQQPSESNSQASSTPKAVTLVRCENCGEQVDRVTHLIRDGPVEIDLSLCDDCLWLRRASWNLKLNKLWKPTPKNAPVMEAKP